MDIALLTRGPGLYSTRRLRESAEARGHRVDMIDHTRCVLLLDSYGAKLLMNGRFHEVPDVIIPRIGASVTTLGASVIDHYDLMGVPSLTSSRGLRLARDKWRCQQLLVSAGIDSPATLLASDPAEARKCARTLGKYPLVVKMLEGTHGIGVSLVHNRYQLEHTCDGFLRFQPQVLIQEYIKEASGSDLRIFMVGDRIVAAMERRARRGEFRANMHLGATATIADLSKEEKALALRVVELLGLEVAGVDILRSKRGPLVMEVNASPGLEGIETTTGVDIAGAIIELAEEKARLSLSA
ncbi:MAG: RimK family alpha-L-glutamate ligase [Bacteroidota bacterium]